MGNNAVYTAFEATTILLYDKGVLAPDVLSGVMEAYRGTDIDSGGKAGTLTKDGLDCEEVVLKVFGVTLPPYPDIPKDWRVRTPEQDSLNDAWQDLKYEELLKITYERFGWR